MMEFPENPTFGNTLGPAVKFAVEGDLEEARRWFSLMVQHLMLNGKQQYSQQEAERITRSNIGYFAGYYGETERRAVADIYGAMHPIFGNDFNPTPEKALEAGKRAAHGEFNVEDNSR
jgi:hypothetical protein